MSSQAPSDSRVSFFVRWRPTAARFVVGSHADLRQGGGFGLDARATLSSPTWQQIAQWWRRRDRSGPVRAGQLLALAKRQRRGWEIPLTHQELADAAGIAKAYLAMSNAMAAGKAKALCAMLASEVELNVEIVDPPLSVQTRLAKSKACHQLLNRTGPWWRYLYDIGPAFLHREASYLLGKLFAMHGSPYEWVPASQEQAYADLLQSQKSRLRCHTWRVLPARGYIGERRQVEVVVLCDGLADYVVGLQGDAQHGFELNKLLVRLQKASP
ncbi:MAG TPA: hypothetical protein DCQ06_01140 [Myxococcales bacterium]|nr:hypothetical protein [Myxococcales bacterium]